MNRMQGLMNNKVETIKTFISHFWLCNCWELAPCSISRASSFHAIFYGAVLHCFQFFFKFLDYTSFPSSFRQYDPITKVFPFYGWLYPFIETALGLAFLLSFQLEIALWVTLFILGSTTFGVIQQLRKKNTIQCACLGTVLNLPMTEATLVENTIMLLMALGMLFG